MLNPHREVTSTSAEITKVRFGLRWTPSLLEILFFSIVSCCSRVKLKRFAVQYLLVSEQFFSAVSVCISKCSNHFSLPLNAIFSCFALII